MYNREQLNKDIDDLQVPFKKLAPEANNEQSKVDELQKRLIDFSREAEMPCIREAEMLMELALRTKERIKREILEREQEIQIHTSKIGKLNEACAVINRLVEGINL